MKKKTAIICLTILLSGSLRCFAQLTIEECYRKAQANYPLIQQYDLIEKTKEYNLSNANKGYLPQIDFSAKASYQSEVTQIPIDFSRLGINGISIPVLSKDQYGTTIDINQTIWDGGSIKSQKEQIETAAEVERKNIEVNIYSINKRVNQLFFGILLTDAQIEQNRLLKEDLKRNYEQISSYMQNGIANQADLDAIKVDLLNTEQTTIQLTSTRKAYTEMLSRLIGEKLDSETELIKPSPEHNSSRSINRPELSLYEAQIRNYEAQNSQLVSGIMPKIGIFATGGYGKPGLDMLKTDFSAYYIVGARLTWKIGNFYTKKNSKKTIQANIKSIETQRNTFLFNTRLEITEKENNIDRYTEQLKYDNEIIELKTSIRKAAEAKMANGTISGTDLARDINAEQTAKQNRILHEMELLLAIYDLKFATNN